VELDTRKPQGPEQELQEESALLEMAFKLQSVTRRLVEAEELERHRIAAELHDRVGQSLSALNINLDIALGLLPKEAMEVKVRIADSLALVEGTLQTIESLMAELRPPLLDEYGLSAALAHYVKGFAQRTGARVVFDDPAEAGQGLRREAAIALFRIAQESLANVAKHAGARNARVLLERNDDRIVLEISDDGRGFDPGERLAHSLRWGVATMHERAAAVGGYVQVESTPGGGTTVRAEVPQEQRP
jgi:two-component system, NarL family, sensor histidine kinase UhpB